MMKKLNKKKRTASVPLLCWDIYAEHLNTLLGKNEKQWKSTPGKKIK